MPLAPASTDFVLAIQTALVDAGMLKDQIVVLDPKSESITPYDPTDDGGGVSTPTVVLGPRAAYIKALGGSVVTEAGLLQGKVRLTVQYIPKAGDPLIPRGSIVRVLPGGDNPNLAHFALEVLAAPGGSIVALAKLECQSNGTPAPVWTGA